MNERLRQILETFSDDEIEEEAERRDLLGGDEYEAEPPFGGVDSRDFGNLADAFYLGKTDAALQLAKDMAERATGRNLL